jgi:hypothetical protein
MNLKNSHNDMAMFALFVDVIHNQSKSIKTSLGHPQSNVAIIVVASIKVRRT